MQDNNEIDISKKEEYIEEVAILKERYKVEKAKLEWADDDWESSNIQDEMNKYVKQIKDLKKRLAAIEELTHKA